MSERSQDPWLEGDAVFRSGVEEEAIALVAGYGPRALSVASGRTRGRRWRLEHRYWDAVYVRVAEMTVQPPSQPQRQAFADTATAYAYAPPPARPHADDQATARRRAFSPLELAMRWLFGPAGRSRGRAADPGTVPPAPPMPSDRAIDAEFVALLEAGLGEIEAGLLYRFAKRLAQIRLSEGEVRALMAQAQLVGMFREEDEDWQDRAA